MADEQNQTAVNSQPVEAASAPAETSTEATNTSASESTGVAKVEEQRIPKSRFDEVIDQRNRERQLREQYENRLREQEARQSESSDKAVVDAQVKRLVEKLNLKEDAAREIVESQHAVSKVASDRANQALRQMQFAQWQADLAGKYKDYKALDGKMSEVWEGMSQQERMLATASKRGLEMLYHYAKGQTLDSEMEKVRTDAAAEAYNTKLAKQAVTSMPGASSSKPAGKLTRKGLLDMSNEEFTRRLPEINDAIAKGLVK